MLNCLRGKPLCVCVCVPGWVKLFLEDNFLFAQSLMEVKVHSWMKAARHCKLWGSFVAHCFPAFCNPSTPQSGRQCKYKLIIMIQICVNKITTCSPVSSHLWLSHTDKMRGYCIHQQFVSTIHSFHCQHSKFPLSADATPKVWRLACIKSDL